MKLFNKNKYFIILLVLLLLDCGIGSYIGVWRNSYWSSISNKNISLWVEKICEFSVAALLSCWVSGKSQYIINIISLNIRNSLTKKAFKLNVSQVEGHEQRIQEDCFRYPTLIINLGIALFRSVVMIIAFSVIILQHVSWYYLLIPIIYAFIGTLLAGKIAYPLISLNYLNQVFEAQFRRKLDKLSYILAHNNNRKLFKSTKYLQYFQSFFQQITTIFPHLCLASLYFSGKIVFGVFMQIAASMTEITNSLSIIILSLNDINNLISCRKRLKELRLI